MRTIVPIAAALLAGCATRAPHESPAALSADERCAYGAALREITRRGSPERAYVVARIGALRAGGPDDAVGVALVAPTGGRAVFRAPREGDELFASVDSLAPTDARPWRVPSGMPSDRFMPGTRADTALAPGDRVVRVAVQLSGTRGGLGGLGWENDFEYFVRLSGGRCDVALARPTRFIN